MPETGSSLATVGSLAAGHGQFRRRSWSIAVATVGRWLAVCIRRHKPVHDYVCGLQSSGDSSVPPLLCLQYLEPTPKLGGSPEHAATAPHLSY